jgi:urease accessory protein
LSPPRVIEVLERGAWSGPITDHITLDYDGRHRRRIVLTADHGARFMLDLPQSRILHGGCALRLEDGALIEVIAKREALFDVRAGHPAALLRLAWHIGNRHLTAQIDERRILIRRDHVIAAMLEGLGATVTQTTEAFDPEGGAYGGAHQAHDHHDHEGHSHHHGHSHAHDH